MYPARQSSTARGRAPTLGRRLCLVNLLLLDRHLLRLALFLVRLLRVFLRRASVVIVDRVVDLNGGPIFEFLHCLTARASARVCGVQPNCKPTFFWGGWQKIVAQIRGVFRKTILTTPPGGLKKSSHLFFVFTPSPRVLVTRVFGFGYFLRPFHLLIEIYPLVPFPPTVGKGFSDYTRTSLQWTPLTVATTTSEDEKRV